MRAVWFSITSAYVSRGTVYWKRLRDLVCIGAVLFLLPIFLTACGKSHVEEKRLVGTWEVDVPRGAPRIIFTFGEDHSWNLAMPNRVTNFSVGGEWSLHQNTLVRKLSGGTNQFTSVQFAALPQSTMSNRIAKLDDQVLVLQEVSGRGETRFKRVKHVQ